MVTEFSWKIPYIILDQADPSDSLTALHKFMKFSVAFLRDGSSTGNIFS